MKTTLKLVVLTVVLASVAWYAIGSQPAHSGKSTGGTVKLPHFLNADAQGFSSRLGKLVPLNKEGELLSLDVDLLWSDGTVLAANNATSLTPFTGKGGIQDLGKRSLADVKEAPADGYSPYLDADRVHVGHTYCVVTADGKHYGKIHITHYDQKTRELTFSWQYQPKATRNFAE